MLTPKKEMAIAHSYLHGTALESMEEEPKGLAHIDVYNYDIGDDLMNGINDVYGSRHLITNSRQFVTQIKYNSKLKKRLLSLIVDMINYLGRKLQRLINILLIPHPKVGIGKTGGNAPLQLPLHEG